MTKLGQEFQQGDHILGVFHDENKIEYGIAFLKHGYEKNEMCLLATDKYSKTEILRKIQEKWKIDEPVELIANKDILIRTPQELLFPNGSFIPNKRPKIWKEMADLAVANGKTGIRMFVDMSPMFKNKFDKEVFKQETSLEKTFDFPATIVCAYNRDDLRGLGKETYKKIEKSSHLSYDGRVDKRTKFLIFLFQFR